MLVPTSPTSAAGRAERCLHVRPGLQGKAKRAPLGRYGRASQQQMERSLMAVLKTSGPHFQPPADCGCADRFQMKYAGMPVRIRPKPASDGPGRLTSMFPRNQKVIARKTSGVTG